MSVCPVFQDIMQLLDMARLGHHVPELTDTEGVSSTLLVGCMPACAEDDNLVPDRFRLRILDSLLLSLSLFRSMLIGDSAVVTETGGSARPARSAQLLALSSCT